MRDVRSVELRNSIKKKHVHLEDFRDVLTTHCAYVCRVLININSKSVYVVLNCCLFCYDM